MRGAIERFAVWFAVRTAGMFVWRQFVVESVAVRVVFRLVFRLARAFPVVAAQMFAVGSGGDFVWFDVAVIALRGL